MAFTGRQVDNVGYEYSPSAVFGGTYGSHQREGPNGRQTLAVRQSGYQSLLFYSSQKKAVVGDVGIW